MMEFLTNLEYWHWLALALVLIIIEMIAPTAVFLWFGVAAGVVGLLLLVVPTLAWQAQLVLFSVLSIGSLLAWRSYAKKHPPADNNYPTLNKRGDDLIGRVFTLDEGIVNNYGKLRVDDTMWKIRGTDASAGARVKVTAVDGTVLVVESEN